MKKILLILFILFVSACSNQGESQNPPDLSEKPVDDGKAIPAVMNEISEGTIAEQLEAPWSINLHKGVFYISERGGTIAVVENGKVERQAVSLSSPLSNAAEAGLLGFVLKEDFNQSKEAYAYYTYDNRGAPFNRIVTLKQTGNRWEETETHLDNVPSGDYHHGGRLKISPAGQLFATIGDAIRPELSQDPQSYNGKVLRMEQNSEFSIFTLGHRNPQGLAWSEEGTLFSSEHGSQANDEINLLVEGRNYGWPIIRGTEKKEGLETPILTSGPNETWAPSGMTFHKGKLYVAALRGEAILVINPDILEIERKIEGYGRVRDVYSDGKSLYFITNNTDGRGSPSAKDDQLYKIPE
ncbi:PQQ-dependent sugar dehydrogenase [Chungangia koreensis]